VQLVELRIVLVKDASERIEDDLVDVVEVATARALEEVPD
jgi:hypothetical protein